MLKKIKQFIRVIQPPGNAGSQTNTAMVSVATRLCRCYQLYGTYRSHILRLMIGSDKKLLPALW
jgi:hypothetical protein